MGGPVNKNLNSTPVRTKIERWEVLAGKAGKRLNAKATTPKRKGTCKDSGRKLKKNIPDKQIRIWIFLEVKER